jgi:hypothetical protein
MRRGRPSRLAIAARCAARFGIAIVIVGDRFALEGTGREFFVSGVGRGTDDIARGDVAAMLRVAGRHAVALRYLWSRRDVSSATPGSRTQIRSTVGRFYSYVGREDFGVVDWRWRRRCRSARSASSAPWHRLALSATSAPAPSCFRGWCG